MLLLSPSRIPNTHVRAAGGAGNYSTSQLHSGNPGVLTNRAVRVLLANTLQVVLEVKDEAALRKLGDALTAAGVKHKMWVEQPENFPTCLATRPYSKAEIGQHFKKYQLSKAPIG